MWSTPDGISRILGWLKELFRTHVDMSHFRPLAIIATYNDHDIAPQVVRKLLSDGIGVHIIDNWSSDGTYEALADLGLEAIERFPDSGASRYFQLRPILQRKEVIAARFPGRWIINQD